MTPRTRGLLRPAIVLTCVVAGGLGAAEASAAPATWYVRAAAAGPGEGSMQRPFTTLAGVEHAAAPGDTIVVLPSPSTTPALDGGIALKAGQKLVGAGAPVVGASRSAAAPRITNSTAARNSGDAVVLADGAEVSNIAVVGAYRGGIYGSDVRNVSVHDNDLAATNAACAIGFIVQPFILPSGLPGVGLPFSAGLSNGWAAIMVDESHTTTGVSIDGNSVHDATCADGIDVRASGSADITVHLDANKLTRLSQDISKSSELAIGLQTTQGSRLRAEVNNNAETYIGSAVLGDFGNSDSEGLFANTAGSSHLVEHVNHNVFAHGLGHLSANCVEEVSSNGSPTEEMTITNSTCDYVVGDIIEAANLAHGTLSLALDHVEASHSTYVAAVAQALVLPGDDGDCLLEVASGSGSTTSVDINNSLFTHCAADGLGVVSDVVDGTNAPVEKLSFDVNNSRITANALSNLHVASATPVQELDGRIEHTDLSRSAGTPVMLDNRLGALYQGQANLDLGGGRLGSAGHNCISGGGLFDATTLNYNLDAKYDWWGTPGGPAPGRTLAIDATIGDTPALRADQCGPTITPGAGPTSVGACTSRRHLRLAIRSRYRRRLLSATVRIGGRRVARLQRGHHSLRINLTGRRAGPITVQIVMRLRDGRTVIDTRRYRLCVSAHRRV